MPLIEEDARKLYAVHVAMYEQLEEIDRTQKLAAVLVAVSGERDGLRRVQEKHEHLQRIYKAKARVLRRIFSVQAMLGNSSGARRTARQTSRQDAQVRATAMLLRDLQRARTEEKRENGKA